MIWSVMLVAAMLASEVAGPFGQAPAVALERERADVVIENARIWSDGLPGFAEFAAIKGGRFIYVGDANAAYIDEHTERIDAKGRVVIPGLIDSHIHMLSGGLHLSRLQLREVGSKAEFIKAVADWAAKLPVARGDEPEQWILGGRWSVESWTSPEQPTKEWVDAVTGDRPLYLPRMDGHSALVNSAALKRAGITKDGPPDPEGGVIDRDPKTGAPTGILRESAMGLVARLIPQLSLDDRLGALNLATNEALRHGITTVCDIPSFSDLNVYSTLGTHLGVFKVRMFLYPTAEDWNRAAELVSDFPAAEMWLEVRGLKMYVDGTLGSRTAYMHEPFLNNEPGRAEWRGLLREGMTAGLMERNAMAAQRHGLQAIAHVIGDEANRLLLDAFEKASPNVRAARWRSEHTQHVLPQDIARFGELGVIASMQPYHKADDGRYAEEYIGEERCRSSYAYKSLLDAGAVVAFGSDWPVVSLNPFLGIEAAVTGRTLDGKQWQTQENLTVGEALRCYTSRAAYAAFAEHEIGRIAPGYRADFVILDRSPFDGEVQWGAIAPVAVYVEGRRMYAAQAAEVP